MELEKVINELRYSSDIQRERKRISNLDENIIRFSLEFMDWYSKLSDEATRKINCLAEASKGLIEDSEKTFKFTNENILGKITSSSDEFYYLGEIKITLRNIEIIYENIEKTKSYLNKEAVLFEENIQIYLNNSFDIAFREKTFSRRVIKSMGNRLYQYVMKNFLEGINESLEKIDGNLNVATKNIYNLKEHLDSNLKNTHIYYDEDKTKNNFSIKIPRVEDITKGKILSYKELNEMAESQGFVFISISGDHAKYKHKDGREVIIPQGKINIGLHNKIIKDIYNLTAKAEENAQRIFDEMIDKTNEFIESDESIRYLDEDNIKNKASNLLTKGLSIEDVAKVTGLSVDEVEDIKHRGISK